MKKPDASSTKPVLFLASLITTIIVLPIGQFLLIYKLLSEEIHHHASFIWLFFACVLFLVSNNIMKFFKKAYPSPVKIEVIQFPVGITKSIVYSVLLLKVISMWLDSILWTTIVVFILVAFINKIEDALFNTDVKNEKKQEKTSE